MQAVRELSRQSATNHATMMPANEAGLVPAPQAATDAQTDTRQLASESPPKWRWYDAAVECCSF